MKILVTGANGYLGARIAQFLAKNGHEVIAFVHRLTDERPEWNNQMFRIIAGDLRDHAVINELAQSGAEAVVHTVSLDHKASQERPGEEVLSVNVTPTWNILEAFSGQGIRFIYFSTQQVYGRIGPERIDEYYPPAPVNVYGLTHLMAENICQYFNTTKGIRCSSIRLSNSFGAPVFRGNNCWWLVVNDFCRSAIEQKKITILSDGSPQRDFIALTDVCRAVGLLIEQEHGDHAVYNLGSGTTLTILELAHRVAEVYRSDYGGEIPIFFADGRRSTGETGSAPKFQYDISRMYSLGYVPEVTLEDGIREVFHYLHHST